MTMTTSNNRQRPFANSLDSFNPNRRKWNTNTTVKPSAKQYAHYVNLCKQRDIRPKGLNEMNIGECGLAIEEMMANPVPTDAMCDKIQELRGRLGYRVPSHQEIRKTMSFDVASKFIESLIAEERKNEDSLPLNEKQIESLFDMFLCPDVDFNELGIPNRIYSEDGQTWRRPTIDEVSAILKENVTAGQAREFVNSHRKVFHTWVATRATQWQINRINELERRIAGVDEEGRPLGSPRNRQHAVRYELHDLLDNPGEVATIEILEDTPITFERTTMLSGVQYNITPVSELKLMSGTLARDYISQLEKEIDALDHIVSDFKAFGGDIPFEHDEDDVEGNADHWKRTRSGMRHAKSRGEYFKKESQKLRDITFALFTIIGYEDEHIEHMTNLELSGDNDSDTKSTLTKKDKEYFREFMYSAVMRNDIQYESLVAMCEDSDFATEILYGEY